MVHSCFVVLAANVRANQRARKAAVELTERAAARIKSLLAKRNQVGLLVLSLTLLYYFSGMSIVEMSEPEVCLL